MKLEKTLPRLLIGASGSGVGKTTVTCGILKALTERGKRLMSFKCGPDYIDPMFHTEVLGIPSRNLDLFFTDRNTARSLMARHGASVDMAVIEGVMGYYDGLAGISTEASSFDVAVATETPSVLLLDGKGKSVSLLAEIAGFLNLEMESRIAGVILNRVSAGLYPDLKKMIEERLPVKVYGFFPEMKECFLESRHLGLITAGEIRDIQKKLAALGKQAEETIDLDGLLRLAETASPLEAQELQMDSAYSAFRGDSVLTECNAIRQSKTPVKIGVALDSAFCFYYRENLELLEELGLKLEYFSPLNDIVLPEGISGLILGGGYPELYLQRLADNISMKRAIGDALKRQMPCIAECGGFMYLQEEIADVEGKSYPMVGAIKGKSYPAGKLGRFGYITMTANKENLLCDKGEILKGHEFHYWDSTVTGDGFHAQKPYRKRNWECVVTSPYLYAGYPHIHFYSNPKAAWRFVLSCHRFCNVSENG